METVASAVASDLFPENRAAILNGLQVAFGCGAAAGPATAYAFLACGHHWQQLYTGFGIANLFLMVGLAICHIPRSHLTEQVIHVRDLVQLGKHPVFILCSVACALYVGTETGFFSWLPTYMNTGVIGGHRFSGIAITIFWIAMTLGRVGTHFLLPHFKPRQLISILGIVGTVGVLVTATSTYSASIIIGIIICGISFAGIFGLILTCAADRFPRLTGTVFGGVVAAAGVGGALIPWLIGAIGQSRYGWHVAIGFISVFSLAISGTTIALRRWDKDAST